MAEGIPLVGVVVVVVFADGGSVAMESCCGGRLKACDDCVVCRAVAGDVDARLSADAVNDDGSLSFVDSGFFAASLFC